MNKFFVPNNVYEDRIAICKACDKYLSLLGNCSICKCFMKVKARLAPMECADKPKKWEKTILIETPDDLPPEIVKAILDLWDDIKPGVAKNLDAKASIYKTK